MYNIIFAYSYECWSGGAARKSGHVGLSVRSTCTCMFEYICVHIHTCVLLYVCVYVRLVCTHKFMLWDTARNPGMTWFYRGDYPTSDLHARRKSCAARLNNNNDNNIRVKGFASSFAIENVKKKTTSQFTYCFIIILFVRGAYTWRASCQRVYFVCAVAVAAAACVSETREFHSCRC